MDLIDRKLLNLIQGHFPLVDRPYLQLGEQLGIDEQEVIERLSLLKRRNVLRQIGAIFDTRRLGYKTTLVAMAHAPGRLHRGALRINRHPGVSHNYAREGSYYNLWFTLAVPPGHDLEATVERMARDTGALAVRIMPTIRFFKIGVNFDMVGQKGASFGFSPDGFNGVPKEDWNQPVPISEADKAAIRELQEDLPLVPRPFDGMARRLDVGTARLFELAAELQERKIMRRYCAVLHHRRSGFRANAMVVWKVPPERSEEVGMTMARHPAVTHCYERPTFPDWPYTHFTMVHATSQEGCEEVEREIGEATGITERMLLYSTREYKKTRVRYFVEERDERREAEQAGPENRLPSGASAPSYYPVYLNLKGKRCVVFGGGAVAQGKLSRLQEAGARITVVSPEVTPAIRAAAGRGDLEWHARKYRPGDLEGAFLAIAATGVPSVTRRIFQESEQRGVLLNAVDDPPRCTFIAPSIVRRGAVTLAISTGGSSPALARKLRESLAGSPALEWADLAGVLSRARQRVKEKKAAVDPQRWQCCVTPRLLELAQAGRDDEALEDLLSRLLDGNSPGLCPQVDRCVPEGCPNKPGKPAARPTGASE